MRCAEPTRSHRADVRTALKCGTSPTLNTNISLRAVLTRPTVKSPILASSSMEESMDPITTAIVAALPALASDLLKSPAKDAYEGLKAVIRRKWGDASPIAKSVDALEASPKSKDQASELVENVAKANATADTEVMRALGKLVDELVKGGIGGKAVARIAINITGGTIQGVVGAENVSVGSMSFGVPPKGGES
jgi:disulfide oxidoreductase YuzD